MTTTTSLTDRYVWAVSRHLPAETGPDVACELRGTLDETIEDRVAAGEDPHEVERAAIAQLGDPDVLAREYGGRPNHLIGSAFYPEWVRLIKFLLAVILPIAVVATFITQMLATDRSFGELIGEVAVVLTHTAVHLVFWSTLIFVLVERFGSEKERGRFVTEWQPESLADPDVPWRRVGSCEMVGEVFFSLIALLFVLWQFAGVGERGVQVLDPDLVLAWKGVVLALLAGDVALNVWVWARGRWSVPLSLANVAANVASAAVLVWLVLQGRLLTDVPVEFAETFGGSADWTLSTPAVVLGVVVVFGWDAVTSLVRVARSVRAGRHLEAGQ